MSTASQPTPESAGSFVRLSSLTPARQESLLELVDPLLQELKSVPVDLLDGRRSSSKGISASVLGNVVAHLHRHRDLGGFRVFVDNLDALDALAAPNDRNPRAHHRALRRVLEPWLREHDALRAHELLFVLAWVRRLLPPKDPPAAGRSQGRGGPRRSAAPRHLGQKPQRQPVVKEEAKTAKPPADKLGNPMADKLAALKAQMEKKEGS